MLTPELPPDGEVPPLGDLAEVRASPIDGLGLFAKQRIPAGTVWWRMTPSNTLRINRAAYETLKQSKQSPKIGELMVTIYNYCYYINHLDALLLTLDDARYVNHADDPNSEFQKGHDQMYSVALRDIEAGEEIVEFYWHYDACPWY
jgi:SET domain-containing protein